MHPQYGWNKSCSPSNSVVDQSAMSHVFHWYLPFLGHRTLHKWHRSLLCIAGFKWDLFPVQMATGLPFVTSPVHNFYGQNF
ncbi:hypothetical protein CHARACLAT_019091 [Characodon lateralis]|uniref:Uncharacterized protein n=1 Tax=Characodon lateralis TaxID=208331 RepID=A0ABU7EC82_9TELE|nr:hypothetical protein [Characodon lateralis]